MGLVKPDRGRARGHKKSRFLKTFSLGCINVPFRMHTCDKWVHIRGGGVHPDFFVKLNFEIAVDQQTRAHDQTFEGVPDSGCPRDSHAHIWSIFPKSP